MLKLQEKILIQPFLFWVFNQDKKEVYEDFENVYIYIQDVKNKETTLKNIFMIAYYKIRKKTFIP